MIKSLKRNDIRYTPFVANKSWNSQNQRFEDLISWQSGSESGSLFLTFLDYDDGTKMSEISSAFSSAIAYQQQDADFLKFRIGKEITGSTFYPLGNQYYNSETNPVNIDESYQSLVYNNVKNLYYKESENPTQIFGLESLDPSNVNRTLPKEISVFNIPVNKFGEKIEPNSVKIVHDLPIGYTTVIDDGNNNLKVSGSTFSDIQNARYNCVSASIIHTKLNQTYDTTQKSASVSTSPSNLTVSTTYNGNSNAPTNAGIYTVFSEISDGFYCGNKTDSFIINKAQASITVNNASNTYTGNRFDVTVTTTPPNLNYSIVYRKNSPTGPISDPIEIGTYYATVTIEDANYSGTGTGTSTVSLPVSVITFNSISNVTYGDVWEIQPIAVDNVNKFPINFTITSGNNLATISGNKISLIPSKTATSLGTVTVTATTVPNIDGVTPVFATQTFTINPKPLTITGVSIKDIVIDSGTTIFINNQNSSLNGVIPNDLVFINTFPSTGTINSTSFLGKYSVLFNNYTITGMHASKYTLQQPNLTVQVTPSKIVFNPILNFTYDTEERNVTSILTQESIQSINDLTVNYYIFNTSKIIGVEKYEGGLFSSKDGIIPTDVGTYTVEIINDESIVKEISITQISIKKAPAYVTFLNLTQGGSFWITTAQKSSKIKPISEEIVDVKITDIEIQNRNNRLISLPNLASDAIILYDGSSTKPTTVGSINVSATINSHNVYYSNNIQMTVNNFIYIVTKDLYETYNFRYDFLESDFSSSAYNLRKYFDPSVTGSWSSVTSTYSELLNFPYNDNSEYKNVVMPGIAIGLTGGGGSTNIYDIYKFDPLVRIEYLNREKNLIKVENKTDFIKQHTGFNKDILEQKNISIISQTTNFYLSSDQSLVVTIQTNINELEPNIIIELDDTQIQRNHYGDRGNTNWQGKKSFNFNGKMGYHKLKIIYERNQSVITEKSLFKLDLNFNPSLVTKVSEDYGGGSGASVGVLLPARYIIDKDLQQVKFIVGKSGIASTKNEPISSFIKGIPARGKSARVAEGTLKMKSKDINFILNAPILTNFNFINNPDVNRSPTKDLIFVGKYVTQEQLDNLGIKTKLNDLRRIKANDNLNISSTGVVDHFLSLGYYIWNASDENSIENNKQYTRIIHAFYGERGRQDSSLDKDFSVPNTFTSNDVLVIGFEDTDNLNAIFLGLHDLTVTVKLDFYLIPGGDTYFITGSSTSANINNAYLGIVAGGSTGGGISDKGIALIKGKEYQGNLYPTNNEPNTPLYLEFQNYDDPRPNSNGYVTAENHSLKHNWLGPYNESVFGNNGMIGPVGGESVDVTQETNKKFGKGGGAGQPTGTRGNFVLSGSNVLCEIYVNSSSVYNVTQVI